MTALPAELHELPLDEKLNLLDLLWADIKSSSEGFEPPAWHARVLEERLRLVADGNVKLMTVDECRTAWEARKLSGS